MKNLKIIQHTSADYLGLMEDHFEGRKIRFSYCRPFTEGVGVPSLFDVGDGLIILGGGPWGSAGGRDVPTLQAEIELAYQCLMANKLVIGFGLGAQILAIAAGGTSIPSPLIFKNGFGRRIGENALSGYLPENFPYVLYMRDIPQPPEFAQILAIDEYENPLAFQMGKTAFGFCFHPGFKLAMAEDLIMEFEEYPENTGIELKKLVAQKTAIEDNLVQFMTGLILETGLMD